MPENRENVLDPELVPSSLLNCSPLYTINNITQHCQPSFQYRRKPRVGAAIEKAKMPSKLEQEVAKRLSASLPNASELLAQRVISLSRSLPSDKAFVNAARAFGRFDESFLVDLRSYIASHPEQVNGKASTDTCRTQQQADKGEPQRERAGLSTLGGEKHVFKAPTSKPKSSLLGLDRLAAAKRAESSSGSSKETSSNKRPRVSGAQLSHLEDDLDAPSPKAAASANPVFKAPSRPASAAQAQSRARGNETPSHTGGLSDSAARRLEEHRRKRAMAADARADASSKGKQVVSSSASNSGPTSSARSQGSDRASGDSWRPSDRNRDSRNGSERNRNGDDRRNQGGFRSHETGKDGSARNDSIVARGTRHRAAPQVETIGMIAGHRAIRS